MRCRLAGWLCLVLALLPGVCPESVANVSEGQRAGETKVDFDSIRRELLYVINTQRTQAGAPPVTLDDLAVQVAEAHAQDMAQHNYLSHWNRDGLLPYMRYGLRGGTHYCAENVSMLSGLSPRAGTAEVKAAVLRLQQAMHDETPPNDGHRRTILNPEHTHVGLGIAVVGRELRLAQEFLSRYVEFEPLPTKVRPGDRLTVVGKVLNSDEFAFYAAAVYHEPLPQPLTLEQLRRPRAYTLPQNPHMLKPRLTDGSQYADGTTGEIEVSPGERFKFDLTFPKGKPGVYTVLVLVQRNAKGESFPAGNLCFWVE
ncbi:MAG: CAP domain-containing protein [Acidobacteriota bacterium]